MSSASYASTPRSFTDPEWERYLETGKEMFLAEVLQPREKMEETKDFFYILINTEGDEGVVWPERNPSTGFTMDNRPRKRILKRAFIKNRLIRDAIINHYRSIGFSYVDITCLNRRRWYIIAHEN